ncbi:dihydrodipicolinate reductase [Candidatus Ruthia magnifica str. Cm (Calyptogena magnifica)]|uniref:4-hydroxy-tetrahydrodipicolinate reductase n=1 Tax=Ruthia magnifica subsp. Calyptogena magnifica TaxID=413404 RepID=A1AX89_RUTMC|nr:4-hydroxy-tetrahydrodipicolinate reductase [Candidatus Ruthturnera calyptogenae]ABL02546.1 dihydrodipicolinate reductase [Candidatus Ruthia magnifica str. Cm (Calyptogena magnifica)]
MVRIAVSGSNGKMGQAIIEAIEQLDEIELGVKIDQGHNLIDYLDKFDILVDFTSPVATLGYLSICAKAGKKMVIGTTGFNDNELNQLITLAQNIPIVFSANMSVGVNLSLKLLEMAAKVVGEDSDIEIIEMHHRFKIDAPSGTALKMGEVIANTLGRDLKTCAVYGREGIEQVRDKNTIGFSTIRGGDVAGEHTVNFFMHGERVEITHKASSRMTFGLGALRAAIWLDKTPSDKGYVYSMKDVLEIA